MPVSNRPWGDFTEADYTPEQFCRAALVDLNPAGAEKVKANCKLPVAEPGGAINRNGVHAAAGRLNQVDPPNVRRAAARKLIGIYRRDLEEDPPDSIVALAR